MKRIKKVWRTLSTITYVPHGAVVIGEGGYVIIAEKGGWWINQGKYGVFNFSRKRGVEKAKKYLQKIYPSGLDDLIMEDMRHSSPNGDEDRGKLLDAYAKLLGVRSATERWVPSYRWNYVA